MRLLLIRHGQTTSNLGHHLDTAEPGADLTDLGRAQAAALPEALADERVDAIYVSTLVRTQQTAGPLAHHRGLTPVVQAGVREIAAGDLEMRNDVPSLRAYVQTVFGWADDPESRMPGGESGSEVLARFDEVVAEAAEQVGEDGTAVVISHGAMIRVWTACRARGLDLDRAARHPLENTALVALQGSPRGGWDLQTWTETALGGAHLTDLRHTGPAAETPADPAELGPQ